MIIYSKLKLMLFICFFLFFPFLALSQEEIIIEPNVIESKAQRRDLLEFTIKIKNQTNSPIRLYPLVKDISGPKQNEKIDKTNSLSDWIEIPRGRIEIGPKENKEIGLTIKVNFQAIPGKYYSAILFAQGSTISEAQENATKYQQPTLLLNIEVEENIIEKAEIQKFRPEKDIFFLLPVRFILEIKNIGNKAVNTRGSIHIYNKLGKEIGTIELEEKTISPDNTAQFRPSWKEKGGFGKYKAILFIEYGEQSTQTLQDTIYFWIFPLQFLAALILLILFLSFILIHLITKKMKIHQQKVIKVLTKEESRQILDLRKKQ